MLISIGVWILRPPHSFPQRWNERQRPARSILCPWRPSVFVVLDLYRKPETGIKMIVPDLDTTRTKQRRMNELGVSLRHIATRPKSLDEEEESRHDDGAARRPSGDRASRRAPLCGDESSFLGFRHKYSAPVGQTNKLHSKDCSSESASVKLLPLGITKFRSVRVHSPHQCFVRIRRFALECQLIITEVPRGVLPSSIL